MKSIVSYLITFLAMIIALMLFLQSKWVPQWAADQQLITRCTLIGGVGGVIYCLRAVYINACVRKCWDEQWHIRPVVSLISGGVSWLFLSAGLLILDADDQVNSNPTGFLALAFIAGYNVDKFMAKLEQLAESAWGIEKSRSSTSKDER